MLHPTLTNLFSLLEMVKEGVVRTGWLATPSTVSLHRRETKNNMSNWPWRVMLRSWMLPLYKVLFSHVRLSLSSKKQFLPDKEDLPMPNGYGTETFPHVSVQPGRDILAAAAATSSNPVNAMINSRGSCICMAFNL